MCKIEKNPNSKANKNELEHDWSFHKKAFRNHKEFRSGKQGAECGVNRQASQTPFSWSPLPCNETRGSDMSRLCRLFRAKLGKKLLVDVTSRHFVLPPPQASGTRRKSPTPTTRACGPRARSPTPTSSRTRTPSAWYERLFRLSDAHCFLRISEARWVLRRRGSNLVILVMSAD